MKNKDEISIWDCAVLFMLLLFLLLSGCNSTKQVTKQTKTVDSSHIKELSDSIRLLKTENEKLTADIRELQYAQVLFDTIYMPGDTVVNTITITKDGEIKATGRITAGYVTKNVLTKIVAEKNRVIDSLASLKQKETVKLVTRTEYKDKYVKTNFLSQWWLFPAGMIFMAAIIYRRKILSLLNSKS